MLEEGSNGRNKLFLTAILRFVPAGVKAEGGMGDIADPFFRFSNTNFERHFFESLTVASLLDCVSRL